MILRADLQSQFALPRLPGGVGHAERHVQRPVQRRHECGPIEADPRVQQQIDGPPQADRVHVGRDHALTVFVMALYQPAQHVINRVGPTRIRRIPGRSQPHDQFIERIPAQGGRNVQRERFKAAFMLPNHLPVDPHCRVVVRAFKAQPRPREIRRTHVKRLAVEPGLLIDGAQMLPPVGPVRVQDGLQVGAFRHSERFASQWHGLRRALQRTRNHLPISQEAYHLRWCVKVQHKESLRSSNPVFGVILYG